MNIRKSIDQQIKTLRTRYIQLYRFSKSSKFQQLSTTSKNKVELALNKTLEKLSQFFTTAKPIALTLGISSLALFSCASDEDGDDDGNSGTDNISIEDLIFTHKSSNVPFNIELGNLDNNSVPSISLGDLDADGDLDLIMGNTDGTFNYVKNNGNSHTIYKKNTTGNPFKGIDAGGISAPALVDFDNDGDLDLIVGDKWGTFKYYKNTGTSTAPSFSTNTTTHALSTIDIGSTAAPYFADIDGDGDQDLIAGNDAGQLYQIYNTGTNASPTFGTPVLMKETSSCTTTNPTTSTIDVGHSAKPSLADIDQDGDLDLIVGNSYGEFNIFENNQQDTLDLTSICDSDNPLPASSELGHYIDDSNNSYISIYHASGHFADIDNDGDLDLITAAHEYYYDYTNYVYMYGAVVKYWKNN